MAYSSHTFQSDFSFRESIASLVINGHAIVKLSEDSQTAMWTALDDIDSVSPEFRNEFSFSDATDGFLAVGGEHAKYTTNVDLCDRFCYWHKNRGTHRRTRFSGERIYEAVVRCESEMHLVAEKLIAGLWSFFGALDAVHIRDSSYLKMCMYANEHRSSDRRYLQDCHEDGHLITLIKPTRDGLVIFPEGPAGRELPVFLRDDELLVITGSLLTALSDGKIPPMYHAVRNPAVRMGRKSVVYFAIPNLSQTYTTLLSRKKINISDLADESHRAFGNSALV